MEEFDNKDRKQNRKNHIVNKQQKNKNYIDDDTKFASKAKKVRKFQLEALEEEELYDEWEEYFK